MTRNWLFIYTNWHSVNYTVTCKSNKLSPIGHPVGHQLWQIAGSKPREAKNYHKLSYIEPQTSQLDLQFSQTFSSYNKVANNRYKCYKLSYTDPPIDLESSHIVINVQPIDL